MPRNGLSAKVKQQIARVSLASGPTLGSIASDLGMRPRTLQRHLEMEGSSFSAILDELRKREATQTLKFGSEDLKALAAKLGYRQQSTLTRAMLRWTGMTPSAITVSVAHQND